MASVRWRPSALSLGADDAFAAAAAANAPLPPPAYAQQPRVWERVKRVLLHCGLWLALLGLAGPRVARRLRGMSYGGLVGRTWTLKGAHEAALALPR